MAAREDAAPDARQCRQVRGFDILIIDTDVANVWKSKSDDLARIGGIGEDLLITSDRRIEANLTNGAAFGAKALASNHRSIGKNEARSRSGLRPGL